MFKRFRLSTRIFAQGIIGVICFVLVLGWVYVQVKGHFMEARRIKTQHVVEVASSTLAHYVGLAKSGAMSEVQAKKEAIAAIRKLRYGKDDYFWINDYEPRMILHPFKPELEGTNLGEFKDPQGMRLFVAFADVCKKDGAGFVNYLWPKPGASQPVPKISYVMRVPEWNWIIGSGIYVDDVQKDLRQIFILVFGVAGLVLAGSIGMSYWTSRTIALPLQEAITGLDTGIQQLASASGHLSSSSQGLADGSSEQAASLEETSS
ncbi:MAG: cache domain-containing protein, partial [Candidatus Deferrimicrobiaceae bacterium]